MPSFASTLLPVHGGRREDGTAPWSRGWRAGSACEHGLCHPVSVTYDPGRRTRSAGGQRRDPESSRARVPCCATSGASRCALSATRWRRTPGGPGPTATSGAGGASRARLGRFISTYGWRAYALPVLVALTVWVVYSDRHGNQRFRALTSAGTRRRARRPSGRGEHGDRRRAAEGADPVRRQPADRHPARRRAVHRGGRQDLAHRAGHGSRRSARAPPRCSPTPSRSRTASTPPRSAATRTSPGWSARPWATRRAGRTTRSSRSPASTSGEPDFRVSLTSPDDGARGLRLRDSDRDVLLQPVLRARRPAAGVHQRGPLGARRGAVPGRRRLLPAVPDQPRGRPRHRLPAPRAVWRERRSWRR